MSFYNVSFFVSSLFVSSLTTQGEWRKAVKGKKKHTTFCVVAELQGKGQNKNEETGVERKVAEVKKHSEERRKQQIDQGCENRLESSRVCSCFHPHCQSAEEDSSFSFLPLLFLVVNTFLVRQQN